jgi:hypothetical protein
MVKKIKPKIFVGTKKKDRSGVMPEFLRNRIVNIDVKPRLRDWLAWAKLSKDNK